MKFRILPLLLGTGLVLLTGCVNPYVITLQNGTRLTTASKPKLKGGSYVFKDAKGNLNYVPETKVRQIEPASDARRGTSAFTPPGR